jgi:hypothetical protein
VRRPRALGALHGQRKTGVGARHGDALWRVWIGDKMNW